VKTSLSSLFRALSVVSTFSGLPSDAGAESIRPTVLVMFQNDAGVSAGLAASVQAEVARLYGIIDVDISWVTKVPKPGRRLLVVSLVTWEPESPIAPSVLGLTYGSQESRGTRAYVFWRRVERASSAFMAALHNLLAVAIAHELGHMLLPDGSHAKHGLMAEPWNEHHFRSASAGLLHFSRESAALIRRGLIEQIAARKPRWPE
jgi:hypothetical protein